MRPVSNPLSSPKTMCRKSTLNVLGSILNVLFSFCTKHFICAVQHFSLAKCCEKNSTDARDWREPQQYSTSFLKKVRSVDTGIYTHAYRGSIGSVFKVQWHSPCLVGAA
jgi:hypothetical protein